jgi:hypothetical protein
MISCWITGANVVFRAPSSTDPVHFLPSSCPRLLPSSCPPAAPSLTKLLSTSYLHLRSTSFPAPVHLSRGSCLSSTSSCSSPALVILLPGSCHLLQFTFFQQFFSSCPALVRFLLIFCPHTLLSTSLPLSWPCTSYPILVSSWPASDRLLLCC